MIRSLAPILRLLLCLLAAMLVAGCSRQAVVKRSLERARGFVEQGEYEKAKVEYLSIIQKNRRQAEAFSQLGRIWSLQGSTIQAYPYLRRAQELGRLPEDLRPQLLRALLGTGQLAEAQREAREILKRDPASVDALMLLAETARTPDQVTALWREFEALPNRDSAAYQAASVPLLLRMNRLLDAESATTRALAMDPKLPAAYLAKAAWCQVNNDQPGIEEALRTMSGIAPLRSPERLRYAEFLGKQGRLEEARPLVAAVLREAPDYLPALLVSAQLSVDAKDQTAAMADLNRMFAIDSTHPQGRMLQADVLLAGNDAPAAVGVLQRLNRMFEQSTEIRMKLARAHIQAGQLTEAADLLNDILVKNPGLTEASQMLGAVQLRQGNPAAVVTSMESVLEKEPESEAASFALALALEGQRRFEEAVGVMRRLAEQSPGNTLYRVRLGQLLVQAGQRGEARSVFEQLVADEPENPEAPGLLLELDILEGKLDEALSRAREWRERHPTSVSAAFGEARVLVQRQEWEAAEKALQRILEADPQFLPATELLVRVYAMTGRVAEALRMMEERRQRMPEDLFALNLLASLHGLQKDYVKAAESYERIRALESEPRPTTLNNLAVLYADHLNKKDEALELARQARSLRPSVAAAATDAAKLEAAAIADTLARFLYERGAFSEAMALSEEAMGFLGSSPEVQAHFGLIAAAMGRREEAQGALTRAVQAGQDFTLKEEARQRLALLNGEATAAQTSAELAPLVRQTPADPLLQARLAEALERENKPAEAAAAYAAALKLNPELAQAALRLAQLYAGPLNDPEKAFGFAKMARDLMSGDAAATALLGALAYRNGEHQWAYDLLIETSRGGTKTARVLMDLGRAAYSLGRVEEARTAVEQALQASPAPDPEAAAEARAFLNMTAVPAPAETVATEALVNKPDHVPALMILAEARQRAGDVTAAVASWRKVLAVYPEFAPARKLLARALASDPATRPEAYDLASKAREALPNDAELVETLATLVHHRKDHRYAVDLFEEAARSRPLAAESLYCLGVSQLALGETESGRASLTRAVAAGLSGPQAAEAARLLQ